MSKCSYCELYGHNSRTCEKKKQDEIRAANDRHYAELRRREEQAEWSIVAQSVVKREAPAPPEAPATNDDDTAIVCSICGDNSVAAGSIPRTRLCACDGECKQHKFRDLSGGIVCKGCYRDGHKCGCCRGFLCESAWNDRLKCELTGVYNSDCCSGVFGSCCEGDEPDCDCGDGVGCCSKAQERLRATVLPRLQQRLPEAYAQVQNPCSECYRAANVVSDDNDDE